MKKVIIFVSVIVVLMLAGSASWYSFSRSQKIAHNISCEQSPVPCAHEIIPPTLWEVITGKTCYGLFCDNLPPNTTGCDQSATTTPCGTDGVHIAAKQDDMNQYVGEITTDAQGDNVYTSKKYGLSFTYPKGWRIEQNNLGYGGVQIVNYDISTVGERRSFSSGQNKIGMGISSNPTVGYTPDYPQEKHKSTQVKVAGADAMRTEVFLSKGVEFLNYIIPLHPQGEYLTLSIFGDTSNFSILDKIAQSVKFSK